MKTLHSILFILFTISIFIFTFFHSSYAQKDSLIIGREYKITLLGGFEMTGTVRSVTPDTVKIKTKYKTFNVPQEQITTIEDLQLIRTDSTRVIFKPDPNESRLFIGPTGKTLKAGHGYVSTAVFIPWFTALVFPFGNVGITDYINLGAGASLYPPMFYVAPKVRALHSKYVDVSIGLAYAQTYSFLDIETDNNFGLLYGVSTFGTDKYSISVGSGMIYGIDWEHGNGIYIHPYPLFMLSIEARSVEDSKFISENWITFGREGRLSAVFSGGFRIINGNFAIDACVIGILTNLDPGGSSGKLHFVPLLWGSVAYNFEL